MRYNWNAIKLSVICVIVFILQMMNDPWLTEELLLNSAELFSKPWMIVTHIFAHGSINHIFFNIFALAMFGSILESIIGGRKFLFVFFASGIVAGLGSFLFYEASLGASGAVMGIMGTLAVLRPRMTVYVSYFPMPMSVAVIVWALGDLFGFFNPFTNVAHIAHLAGMAIGLIYGLKVKNKYGRKYPKRIRYREIGEEKIREWEDEWL